MAPRGSGVGFEITRSALNDDAAAFMSIYQPFSPVVNANVPQVWPLGQSAAVEHAAPDEEHTVVSVVWFFRLLTANVSVQAGEMLLFAASKQGS